MPTAVQCFSSTAAASSPDGASNDQALRRQPRPPCYTPADLDHQGQAPVRPPSTGARNYGPLHDTVAATSRHGPAPGGGVAPRPQLRSRTSRAERPYNRFVLVSAPPASRRAQPAATASSRNTRHPSAPTRSGESLRIRRSVASAGPRNVHVTPCPGAAVPQSGQVTLPPRSSLVAPVASQEQPRPDPRSRTNPCGSFSGGGVLKGTADHRRSGLVAPVASQEQPRPDPHSPATSAARALGGGVLTWEPPATYKRRHTERLTT